MEDGNLIGGLRSVCWICLLVVLSGSAANGQEINREVFTTSNKATLQWTYYDNVKNPLFDFLMDEAYTLIGERVAWEEDQSLDHWKARQQEVKNRLREAMNLFPEKTPLNARVTRTIRKEGFRVEHIVFESLPGFYVTSSLFLPSGKRRNEKLPAVIYCSGHNPASYDNARYQHEILNFVKKGFAVFAFDPIGQGERLEYINPETGGSTLRGGSVVQHSYPGLQAFVTGNAIARYMIWDGIRAVDYLMTRKEVDPARIGITGRSGGGTQSAFIAAVDDRIYLSAPECWITNRKRLLQSIGPQDADQNLLFEIERGIDHSDYLMVRAPKPTLIVTTTNDFFAIQGARETARDVSKVYRAYGQEENLQMIEDIGIHESTKANREVKYAFFQKHLNNPGSSVDEDVEPLTPEEMQVTPTGQATTSFQGVTTFKMNGREADRLRGALERSREDLDKHIPAAVEEAKKISGFRAPSGVHEPFFTGSYREDELLTEKYFIEGEGDYVTPYLLHHSAGKATKVVIYLHPEGKALDSASVNDIEWFRRQGFAVLAADLLGTGETGPGTFRGDSHIENVSYNTWFGSMLTKRSIAAVRASDVIRLATTLEKVHGFEEVYAVAKGNMTPVLQHAAAFYDGLKRIALISPLTSYHSLVTTQKYSPRFALNAVAGALNGYDLPDLSASVAPRKQLIVNAVDAANSKATAVKDFAVVTQRYRAMNAGEQLQVRSSAQASPADVFGEWLKP